MQEPTYTSKSKQTGRGGGRRVVNVSDRKAFCSHVNHGNTMGQKTSVHHVEQSRAQLYPLCCTLRWNCWLIIIMAFETGRHYVAKAGLEHTMHPRLASTSSSHPASVSKALGDCPAQYPHVCNGTLSLAHAGLHHWVIPPALFQ